MSTSKTSRWSLFAPGKSQEDALRERDAILTLAEQSAGIGVWDVDLKSGMARGTPQFFRIMGLEPTDQRVAMERLRGLRHPEDRERVVAGFRQALESGSDTYEMEYRIVRPDGQLRWIFGRGRVVRDARGTPVRYSGVDIDITERKETAAALAAAKAALERVNQELEERVRSRTVELEAEARRRVEAEARLHQAQKMEAVGQLTGGVAHDFNNILQVIMGNLELLRRGLQRFEPPGAQAATRELWYGPLDTALQATRNAAQLTHRLLAFSRLQPLEPAVLDVNALIGDMSLMIRHTLGETVQLRTRLAAGLWPTFADRNQLETAFLNLVVNARDAMPEGGELAIETSNVDMPGGEDFRPGPYVMLEVRDTGCGIPAELLDKVFEPFFTTKETGKGSGLGLSMVYGFARQSGGQVRIASRVGAGTAVRLYLPRSRNEGRAQEEQAQAATAIAGESLPHARAGETVLVVEDNEEVRRYAVSALQSLGYQVLQAADGPAALLRIEAAPLRRLDLLFTDMVMPGGLNGRALAERVLARFPGLPVLFATGYTRDDLAQDTRLLPKPYDLETLARQVRQAIDG
ncbi:MAG TPA: ATP-binding protein [Burkholderiales bacterium]|nr:ATP-binding protein [Burkholderiales bacterium]